MSGLQDQGVEIWVIDDGFGLAPGTEEVVFERFASLDGAGGELGSHSQMGAGLLPGGPTRSSASTFSAYRSGTRRRNQLMM